MMMLLKNILVVMVLLAVILPCSHVIDIHDDHGSGFAQELCDCRGTHCDCYSDNHLLCITQHHLQSKYPPASRMAIGATAVLVDNLVPPPTPKHAVNFYNSMLKGALVSILTVQLLI